MICFLASVGVSDLAMPLTITAHAPTSTVLLLVLSE
jgi:hypothetical protein